MIIPIQLNHGRSISAFSLVELIVVIGIIGLLIAILMPSLHKARMQAKAIACQSNLRSIGQAMLIYANANNGWLFPPDQGLDVPIYERWFLPVLKPPRPIDPTSVDPKDWTPRILLCPADDPDPQNSHSYLLNHHLPEHGIRYSSKPPAGLTPETVIVMGEKLTNQGNYYVETKSSGLSTYNDQVELRRHGYALKSNYLYLDLHVDNRGPNGLIEGVDPWDFP